MDSFNSFVCELNFLLFKIVTINLGTMNLIFKSRNLNIVYIVMVIALFISSQVYAQGKKKFPENGYYISLENDTIYGNLENEGSMYLIYRDEKGKKKKFSPSRIQGFYLNNVEYIPLYVKGIDLKIYVSVRLKGYYTVLRDDYFNSYSTYGQMGLIGGAVEGAYKSYNSGYYVYKGDDKEYYSIPASPKLLRKYLVNNFGDDPFIKAEAANDTLSVKSVEAIFKSANELKRGK